MFNNDESYIGQKYGRLTVQGFEKGNRCWKWVCKCDCGKVVSINAGDVKQGRTKSCGCLHDEVCKEKATKFVNSVYDNKRLYGIYNGIKKRCYKESEPRYPDYGGRGIIMEEEWLNPIDGFDNFCEWAKANGYAEDLTIDRIDPNGNYCASNCRWSTYAEQNINKRETKWVDYQGEHIQLKVLCKRLGLKYDTVHARIYQFGWSVEDAVSKPSQLEGSFAKKCREHGINQSTAKDRIVKFGWSEEKALNTPSVGRGANKNTYKDK